jgi:hypothetical protein
MYNYTVIIFILVPEWRPKFLDLFISWGWKVSAAVIDSSPGLQQRKASSALDFHIECSVQDGKEIRDKIENILNELEIYWFGLTVSSRNNGNICWAASNSKLKQEPKTPYRD